MDSSEIEMMAVGEQAYLKFSEDAPWAPLPLDQVPFNFAGLGVTLRDVLNRLEDTAITGREAIQDAQTVRVEGSITSDALVDLITTADPGHDVTLTLWIDEADQLLRQIRIAGQIYDDDGPETTRLLTIEGIDMPVDIPTSGGRVRPVNDVRNRITSLGTSQPVVLGIICLGVFSTRPSIRPWWLPRCPA